MTRGSGAGNIYSSFRSVTRFNAAQDTIETDLSQFRFGGAGTRAIV